MPNDLHKKYNNFVNAVIVNVNESETKYLSNPIE